jgi:adenosine kinase
MLKKQSRRLAVSGSLAYDQIMDFPGKFHDHILPGQIHNLNVSFLIGALRRSFGGTAGNIAYNLSLLGLKPLLFGVVGSDFLAYEKWLKKNGTDLSQIAKVDDKVTAAAYIITDQTDNQITAFYPGPDIKNYARRAASVPHLDLAIIAADDTKRMLEYATIYRQKKVPFIFDPGQQLTALNDAELRGAIKGAKVLIGNDYEIKLISKRLKLNLAALAKMVEILVVTKGGTGSEIYSAGKKVVVPPAKPKNTSDPTGAGDAYRAGLIYGLLAGYDLKTCGQLAGLVAVYTVEAFGTQTHQFMIAELRKRYYDNYREKLVI